MSAQHKMVLLLVSLTFYLLIVVYIVSRCSFCFITGVRFHVPVPNDMASHRMPMHGGPRANQFSAPPAKNPLSIRPPPIPDTQKPGPPPPSRFPPSANRPRPPPPSRSSSTTAEPLPVSSVQSRPLPTPPDSEHAVNGQFSAPQAPPAPPPARNPPSIRPPPIPDTQRPGPPPPSRFPPSVPSANVSPTHHSPMRSQPPPPPPSRSQAPPPPPSRMQKFMRNLNSSSNVILPTRNSSSGNVTTLGSPPSLPERYSIL